MTDTQETENHALDRLSGRPRRFQRTGRAPIAGSAMRRFCPASASRTFSRASQEGRAAGAVIPIENTLAGSVHENYDHLLHFDLPIVGETSVRIVHNLIAPKGVPFGKIKRVFSHPVALNQCLDFFRSHPEIERIPYYDTAGSVKMVVEEKLTDAAAIASAVAAEIYGARILRKSVEDDRQNFTRFFLLRTPEYARRHPCPAAEHAAWKTSLVFSTRNIPGSLVPGVERLCVARSEPGQDRIAAFAG